jgi:predicted Holliday junction resolvase-like endonuclease
VSFTALAIVSVVVIVLAIAAVIAAERLEMRSLRRRFELTDEEVDFYQYVIPQSRQQIAESLAPGMHSRREMRRMAVESVIKLILSERVRRAGRRKPAPPSQAPPSIELLDLEPGKRDTRGP